jgi:hypothetical protein
MQHLDGKRPFHGVCMRKYENKDLSPIQFEKYQFDQDFDPAYGLEGLIASSVLDWERRQIFLALQRFPFALQVKYIDECGQAYG